MSENLFVEPTDVLFEPRDDTADHGRGSSDCKHCGKWLGLHWKHEDGRITCTQPKRRAQPQGEKHE